MTTAHPAANAAPMEIAVPAADLLPVCAEATPAFRLVQPLAAALLRLLFKVRVHGRDRIPEGNLVAISNHLQWVDAVVELTVLPLQPRVHAMGDPTDIIRRGGALWWAVRKVGGLIPIDRNHHGNTVLFDHVHRCLSVGGSILIFPEGRCGDTEGELLPFKKGFAHFALRSGVPVLPMSITGTRTLWLRSRIDITIGEAIDTTGMDVDRLTNAGRAAVAATMRPYRGRGGPKLLKRRLTRLF